MTKMKGNGKELDFTIEENWSLPSKTKLLLEMNCRIVLLILTASLLVDGGRQNLCNRRCRKICAGVSVIQLMQDPAYNSCLRQRIACNRRCPPTQRLKHFDKPKVRAM